MSNMLQLAIHLFDAGIACLVFLAPSKQLVQGSTRIKSRELDGNRLVWPQNPLHLW